MKCRICDSEMNMSEVLLDKVIAPNIMREPNINYKKTNIEFFRCPCCTMGQIDYMLNDDYYEGFSTATIENLSSSEKVIQEVRESNFTKVINNICKYSTKRESLFEIGSGCGYLLEKAKPFFEEVVGIEPSKVEAQIAKEKGFSIINDYFTENLKIDRKFSAFVSTEVFEHAPDPQGMMNYAFTLLEEGGVGLVEVPNGQKAFNESAYYDIFVEHINYFTPKSLLIMAEKAGFEVISISEEFETKYLAMYIRKPHKKVGFMKMVEIDKIVLDQLSKKYKVIGIWGASFEARSIIPIMTNKSNVKYLFDASPNKTGTYINECPQSITYPNKKEIQNCDAIYIFAFAYKKEITKNLRDVFGFTGDIVVLEDIRTKE